MEENINIDDHDNDLIKKAIAYTIKEKRVNYPGHMSQRRLAERASVSVNTIILIEKARMCPTLTMILRLSQALDYENKFEILKYIEEKYKNLKII